MKKGALSKSHPTLTAGIELTFITEWVVLDLEHRAPIGANDVIYGPKVFRGRTRCKQWAKANGYGELS